MKHLLLISAITVYLSASAQSNGSHVIAHNRTTITCDPVQGVNSFKQWAVFPSPQTELRKITMLVTLAYPHDRAIAHWDYIDRINILRSGGVRGQMLNYEIGRMLTPYGSSFAKDWSYTWQADVTDFEHFMRDSVEIEYIHSGWESTDVGWDLTVAFKIDHGPAAARFLSVEKMWNGNYQYGNPENDIENHLTPKTIKRAKGSSFGRFRIQHTGHGMDKPSGCSEFCSRWRRLLLDGEIVQQRDLWKECGSNPLYPQGGTWIFDRGNWCPGDLQVPDIVDVPLTKNKHTLDLDMEPFTATDTGQPKEQITAYFFQFAEPERSYDVAIEEILAPNNNANYNRINPRGFNPQIKIRNLGKEILRTVKITHNTLGHPAMTYQWHGELNFYESAIITLDGEIMATPGTNTFQVMLSEPNGVTDQWGDDNFLSSEFNDIPTLPTNIVVDFLSNNKPEENSLFIANSANEKVFVKSPEQLEPATQYTDTLHLIEGSYYLMLTDSAGDGLEFWYKPAAGYGRLRLKDLDGNVLHVFESDCGNGQFYAFKTNSRAVADTSVEQFSAHIFPRMVKDHLTVYTTSPEKISLKVRITKDGKYIEEHEYTNIKDSATGMDVKHLEEGRYVMEIYVDGKPKMNRRFNKI